MKLDVKEGVADWEEICDSTVASVGAFLSAIVFAFGEVFFSASFAFATAMARAVILLPLPPLPPLSVFLVLVTPFACGDGDLEWKGDGDLDFAFGGFDAMPLTSTAMGDAFSPVLPTCHGFSYSSLFAFNDASSTSDGCLCSVGGGGVDSFDLGAGDASRIQDPFADLLDDCLVGDISLDDACLVADVSFAVACLVGDDSLVNACFAGDDSLDPRLIGDASLVVPLVVFDFVGEDSLVNEFFLALESMTGPLDETPGDFSLI